MKFKKAGKLVYSLVMIVFIMQTMLLAGNTEASSFELSFNEQTGMTASISDIPSIAPTPTATPKPTPQRTFMIQVHGYIEPDFSYSESSGTLVKPGFKVTTNRGDYITTFESGTFYITVDSYPYEVDIKIEKPGYLTRELKGISVNPIYGMVAKLGEIQMWAGDLPQDGSSDNAINMSDIMTIAKSFNMVKGDPRYDANSDFNKDNVVSMQDIMIAAMHFNATSGDYPQLNQNLPPIPTPYEGPAGNIPSKFTQLSIWVQGPMACSMRTRVHLVDENNNPLPGRIIQWGVSGHAYGPDESITDEEGYAQASFATCFDFEYESSSVGVVFKGDREHQPCEIKETLVGRRRPDQSPTKPTGTPTIPPTPTCTKPSINTPTPTPASTSEIKNIFTGARRPS